MALPRVVRIYPQGGQPIDEFSGGGFTPIVYPELLASPTPAQDAAARARPMLPPGVPWIPYTPMYSRGPIGPNDMGINEADEQPPEWPVYWFANYYGKTAWPGAGPFLKAATEADAERKLRALNVDVSREFMTLDAMDPGKGPRDRRMVLYARSGDLWQPLASYPYYKPSSWVTFRDEDLIPIASVALAVAGAPILQAIGNALVPASLAASFPALPQAVGTVALQTATNGGDLGAALQSALLSSIGAQAGAMASDLSGMKALGAATSAATTAALRGGNVDEAVRSSLLSFGVQNMGSIWDTITSWGGEVVDMFGGDDNPIQPSADYFDPVYGEAWDGTVDVPGFDPNGMQSPAPVPAPAAGSSGWDFGTVVQNLTTAAMAAIKVNQAYQATQAQPRTQIVSGSTVQTPQANGTLTVRNAATGQVSTQRPPVGMPFVLADGRTIINNGDGTYTLIARDGSSQRLPYQNLPTQYGATYGGTGSGFRASSIPPAYIAAGVGVLALVLLSRSRAR